MRKRNKIISIALLSLLVVGLVSAGVLTFYGKAKQDVSTTQAVILEGGDECESNICIESIDIFSPGTTISEYTLTNRDPDNNRNVNVTRTSCIESGVGENCDGITTSYLESIAADYSYEGNHLGVNVAVTNDGDWLQWTYTYAESPTHTPKMTVAIDYPNGFAITTFDDGGHDGWYYAIDDGETVRLGDYSGITEDWVITTASGNVLTVSIKKSELGNTFKWHGYANYDGLGVWINAGETGTGYSEPIFEATIRTIGTALENPVTVPAGDSLNFFIVNDFVTTDGTYTITTEAEVEV